MNEILLNSTIHQSPFDFSHQAQHFARIRRRSASQHTPAHVGEKNGLSQGRTSRVGPLGVHCTEPDIYESKSIAFLKLFLFYQRLEFFQRELLLFDGVSTAKVISAKMR